MNGFEDFADETLELEAIEIRKKPEKSSFADFMNKVEKSSDKSLTSSKVTLPGIQSTLSANLRGVLAQSAISKDGQQKFIKGVCELVKDKNFIADISARIGEPREHESEDEFVNRGCHKLRQMLQERFSSN